jgi:D-alanyl-lipoteichoic acid acyltransferase DltB (MBOAT superfamily)
MVFVPVYILILGFTIVIDYFAGIYLEKSSGKKRKWFLIASLIANIGVLAIFKYYNFINENLTFLLHGINLKNTIPYLSIILPVGLSFHTFQAMSYTLEIFHGRQKAEHHFGIYALYVMFFPQLVAGPIERPQNLLWQFRTKKEFDYDRITSGLKLMLWGAFKKIVIADRLSVYVNTVYAEPRFYSGFPLLLATLFFTLQIYCDFSGYSDIAIGTARILGFKLMKNFNLPYSSKTISEFWKRWHISLSTWFRDYLYIPLGGNRVSKVRLYFNLFFVFMVSGLWHGANWTFIIWGGLHGIYLIVGLITKNLRRKLKEVTGLKKSPGLSDAVSISLTFFLVAFAWIFFRAANLNDAIYIVTHILDFKSLSPEVVGIKRVDYLIIIISLFVFGIVQHIQINKNIGEFFKSKNNAFRWSCYICLSIFIIFFGRFGNQSFIYFQF